MTDADLPRQSDFPTTQFTTGGQQGPYETQQMPVAPPPQSSMPPGGGLPPGYVGGQPAWDGGISTPGKKWYQKWWVWLLIILGGLILISVLANLGGSSESDDLPAVTPDTEQSEVVPEEEVGEASDQVGALLSVARANLELEGFDVEAVSDSGKSIFVEGNWMVVTQAQNGSKVLLTVQAIEGADDEDQESTTQDTPATPSADMTTGQKNAVRSAEQYLAFTAFSRSGLIEQLEFEGFSNEDATFAVDRVNPDWNEQAALSAQTYLEFTSFSRSGLIEQLVFEGFTAEQAEYGVSAAGY